MDNGWGGRSHRPGASEQRRQSGQRAGGEGGGRRAGPQEHAANLDTRIQTLLPKQGLSDLVGRLSYQTRPLPQFLAPREGQKDVCQSSSLGRGKQSKDQVRRDRLNGPGMEK